ncbi:MAG: S1C family serine protease, partial [Planctomycetaceae bacterium]|nr:S1C family serine protease [Planctomycetaceae bacterium]
GIVGRCSFEKRGRVNVGIGFAVSSNQVRYFLGVLKSGQIVDHSTMNAAVSTDKSGRVLFSDVLGTADAYRSGLRYDDELLRFAGRTIDSANTFKNVLGIFPKGWRLPVTVRGSDGKRFETFVRLAGLHSEAELQQWTAESGFWKMKDDKKLPKNKERKKTSAAPALPPSDYESRTGYANFYYNRIERQRVLKAFRNWTLNNGYWTTADKDAAANNASWTISTSKTAFVVSDGGIQYTLPLGKGFWNVNLMLETKEFVTDPLSHYQAPRGSGGLFTALYLMRRLYLSDDAADADIVYTGTAPLAGNLDVLCDVITAAWRGNEVRFYFAPATGKPVLVEMFGSAIEHPCEVYFRGNGIEVRCGKNTFLREEGETKSKEDDDDNALVSKPSLQQLDKTSPHFVLHTAMAKVVRIYGASAGGIHGYQSGVLVSENGRVLTALTSALQSSPLRVVLHDGRQYEAEMTQADIAKETALLQIKTEDANERFAYFVLPDKEAEVIPPALPGTAVYALSNPFNIAEGSEAVSVQKGQIAARTLLSARRGVFETPYRGGIYVVDFTVNNPGACGGAVIAADTGALLGIIGKELRNKENNAWLNYAVPVTSLASNNSSGGTVRTERREWQRELIPEDTSRTLQAWGLLLITPVGERTPPFVDAVLPDSAAAKAGVQPDDLIVMFNGVLTPSLAVIGELINQADKTKPVVLSVERSHTLLELTIKN